METLQNILWPTIAIGVLGVLIEFLIGKAGQEKAKSFLLKWWMRFDDVHLKNFGRTIWQAANRTMVWEDNLELSPPLLRDPQINVAMRGRE
jgi:hypothetical protein